MSRIDKADKSGWIGNFDGLMPAQVNFRGKPLGFSRLLYAILDDAAHVLFFSHSDTQDYQDARAWVALEDFKPFGFRMICEWFEINHENVRARLLTKNFIPARRVGIGRLIVTANNKRTKKQ